MSNYNKEKLVEFVNGLEKEEHIAEVKELARHLFHKEKQQKKQGGEK